MQNKNEMIITGATLKFSGFWGISSFSDWFRICGIWSVLYYNFLVNFCINLTQLYINFSRQKHQIDVLYVFCIRLKFSGLILYLLSFFLHGPFKSYLCMRFIFDICEEISAFVHSLEIWRHFDLSWISEIIVIN